MWRRAFLTICFSSVLTVPAMALERPFPAPTKRGTMSPAPHPLIVIDGKTRRLSPGARIWSEKNLIQMPASIRGSDIVVNYTENHQGDIDRVWILTPQETSQSLKEQVNPLQQ